MGRRRASCMSTCLSGARENNLRHRQSSEHRHRSHAARSGEDRHRRSPVGTGLARQPLAEHRDPAVDLLPGRGGGDLALAADLHDREAVEEPRHDHRTVRLGQIQDELRELLLPLQAIDHVG